MKDNEYEAEYLSKEEIEIVVRDWLMLAIYEGGGLWDDELKIWFPLMKKLAPPSMYRTIADSFCDSGRSSTIGQEFLEYVGLEV